jgi:hypothetical protein
MSCVEYIVCIYLFVSELYGIQDMLRPYIYILIEWDVKYIYTHLIKQWRIQGFILIGVEIK